MLAQKLSDVKVDSLRCLDLSAINSHLNIRSSQTMSDEMEPQAEAYLCLGHHFLRVHAPNLYFVAERRKSAARLFASAEFALLDRSRSLKFFRAHFQVAALKSFLFSKQLDTLPIFKELCHSYVNLGRPFDLVSSLFIETTRW